MSVTYESFLKDVSQHQIEVLKEEGLFRQVRFAKPGCSDMQFDLVTWPGHLCYTGDMGTYVFARVADMFDFFSRGAPGRINPDYWGEKVQAADRDGVLAFDTVQFEKAVKCELIQWLRDNAEVTTKDERRELWDEVMDEVIAGEGLPMHRVHQFGHYVSEEAGDFYFENLYERDLQTHTERFLWCCHAIAWGVRQYKAQLGERNEQA